MTGTLFLHAGKWKYSERTSIGFRHTLVGNVNNFPTQAQARERLEELLARRIEQA